MPEMNVNVTQAFPLTRALVVSAQPGQFSASILPTLGGMPALADGIFDMGEQCLYSVPRLFIQPFAKGPAGLTFSLRLWGWSPVVPGGDQAEGIAAFLAEFSCTTGEIPGPSWPPPSLGRLLLSDSERLCDTIGLTQGAVGMFGEVNSTGPGTNLPAFAIVDLRGCQRIQFDFQTDDGSVNALWRKV